MADRTIEWLHGVRAQDAHKPFFAYFSTGCSHAPHHVAKEWADKYKGKFDQGWDKLREETFARQKELGVIPADAELTPRNEAFPAWDDVPDKLKAFYARQMEVYAGYSENADYNVGRVIDAIEELGELDNTLILWIWGDNGASMEGTITGSFNELTMQNGIPLTDEMQLAARRALRRAGASGARRSWIPTTAPRGRGPGTRRSSGASRSARTSAGHATRWSCTGPIASATSAGCVPSSPTSSTWRRRSSTSPGSRCPRASTASNSSRCTVPRSPRRSPTAAHPNTAPSSTSKRSATAACTRTAGGSR